MTITSTQFGCSTPPPQFGCAAKPQFGNTRPGSPFFAGPQDPPEGPPSDITAFSGSEKPKKNTFMSRFWDKHPGLYVKLANVTNHPAWSAFP